MQHIEERLRKLEAVLANSQFDTRQQVQSELYHRYRMDFQPEVIPHMFSALVVNTLDPMAEGQVQFYTPYLTKPGTELAALPWAAPISPFPGFDDSGCTWVPPAGAKIAILCEGGDRNQCYYIGSFWDRTRGKSAGSKPGADAAAELPAGPEASRNDIWGIPVPEFDCLWSDSRDGYNLGPDDGSQVKPPWNTDNHQVQDWDSTVDFQGPADSDGGTYPHQYGFKTNGKSYVKMDDGDPRHLHRGCRVEVASGRGGIILIKDDHLHPATWPFQAGDASPPPDPSELFENFNPGQCSLDSDEGCVTEAPDADFANPFYKRQEEMRLHQPPEAFDGYQDNRCSLPQSGIQIQSISRAQFVMDDSVDQPQGEPTWKQDFDWGCNNQFMGKVFIRTATGHVFRADDSESATLVRGENNGIFLETATGISLSLCDHTLGAAENPGKAGSKRGAVLRSSADHVLEFHDEGNDQRSPDRAEGGEPAPLADQAYVLLRSGYGFQIRMQDNDQSKTKDQYLQILSPQKDNEERGPHQLMMQESADGPGYVMLRAGGVMYHESYDDSIEVVGTEDNPSNKFVTVTNRYVVNVKDYYFNHNAMTLFHSDSYVFLLAGQDCPPDADAAAEAAQAAGATAMRNVQIARQSLVDGTPNQAPLDDTPCVFPIILAKNPFVCPFTNFVHFGVMSDATDPTHQRLLHNSISDRVFASSSRG